MTIKSKLRTSLRPGCRKPVFDPTQTLVSGPNVSHRVSAPCDDTRKIEEGPQQVFEEELHAAIAVWVHRKNNDKSSVRGSCGACVVEELTCPFVLPQLANPTTDQ